MKVPADFPSQTAFDDAVTIEKTIQTQQFLIRNHRSVLVQVPADFRSEPALDDPPPTSRRALALAVAIQ